IAIRLAYKKGGKVYVRAGAGIVADSVAEREFEETINKMKAVVNALDSQSAPTPAPPTVSSGHPEPDADVAGEPGSDVALEHGVDVVQEADTDPAGEDAP
ncbi:MAG: chorismate-binding protein, partial [Propionibacteriaceae bacterium]|nr:chorismate-binding protein [Propionibacteriaceae bacterium]